MSVKFFYLLISVVSEHSVTHGSEVFDPAIASARQRGGMRPPPQSVQIFGSRITRTLTGKPGGVTRYTPLISFSDCSVLMAGPVTLGRPAEYGWDRRDPKPKPVLSAWRFGIWSAGKHRYERTI